MTNGLISIALFESFIFISAFSGIGRDTFVPGETAANDAMMQDKLAFSYIVLSD